MQRILAAVVVAFLTFLLSPVQSAEARTFRNCIELRKVYPTGISASKYAVNRGSSPIHQPRVSSKIYKQNVKLDLDRDKIVCELINRFTQPPAPNATEAYVGPSSPSEDIDQCKIKESSQNDVLYGSNNFTKTGFPPARPTTSSGTVKWALIPIKFADSPEQGDFRPRVNSQMALLSDWFSSVSGGKFVVQWVVSRDWVTLPGKASDYLIERSVNVHDAANGPKLFRDAMAAADPVFDFTAIQTVNFILPKDQTVVRETSQGFPWDQVVKDVSTNEGKISSYSIAGTFMDDPRRAYWSYWAHEFGHAMGLPHIGASRGSLPPFNPWDLMGGQDGPARELTGWLRFLAGWLEDDQVYCRQLSTSEVHRLDLVPLNLQQEGVKLAAFPLSNSKILLVESRRETKFSCPTSPARNGVLVYVYDATLGHNQDFLIAAEPAGRTLQYSECLVAPNPDFLLRANDKVTIGNVTVSVLRHGKFDSVEIQRG